MLQIFLLLLILLAGLMAIAWFIRRYTALCYKLIVSNPSELIDQLKQTGEVPLKWRKRTLEKIAISSNNSFGRRLEKRLICSYAKRVNSLSNFVRGNRRIAPEETREISRVLRDMASQWRACDRLEDLIGSPEP